MITTKDKPEGRVDDPYLVEKLIAEKESIFLWCLEGFKRLVANDYRFTISGRSKDNIDAIMKDANNILEFLASEGYLTFHEDSKAATSDLYAAYKEYICSKRFEQGQIKDIFQPDKAAVDLLFHRGGSRRPAVLPGEKRRKCESGSSDHDRCDAAVFLSRHV